MTGTPGRNEANGSGVLRPERRFVRLRGLDPIPYDHRDDRQGDRL